METGLTKNKILSELAKSPHGNLKEYIPVGREAATAEPEFLAHLVAWNHAKGQVRDAKVALPIVALLNPSLHEEFEDNALAHIASHGPRELLKSFRFAKEAKVSGQRKIRRLVSAYLREREQNAGKWDRIALQHRHTIKELYALAHLKPGDRANEILFKNKYPEGSLFDIVSKLKDMTSAEAAGTIMEKKIPFLVATGALGPKLKDTDLVLALIKSMTATELVTNTKFLERLGIKTNPVLRGAFEEGLAKVAASKKNVLKTSRAAEALPEGELKEKLRGAQHRQLESMAVEGNWLVLADKSGSMTLAIDAAKHIAATLAKMVKGKVWLVFFDTDPVTVDVTGLPLDHIQAATKHIQAAGGTSIGCGLDRMLKEKAEIDGICIVSDGEENNAPWFASSYIKYTEFAGKEVPVYFYHVAGSGEPLIGGMTYAGNPLAVFDLRASGIDYYSLPAMVGTMRTNRYSLVDEIMAFPLKRLRDVLKVDEKEVRTNA